MSPHVGAGWLTEPLAYAFFGRALIAGIAVGAVCGALSTLVVLRRMSYIGHGLAHAVLGGVGVGVALGVDLYLGAAAATAVAAVLIDRVGRRRGLHADAAIGIVTTAIFAAGIAALTLTPTPVNVEALLFGNILGVDVGDLLVTGGVALVTVVVLATAYKRLVSVTFDPEVARVHGLPAGRYELLINLLVAGVVVASVRVLGALLIAAAVVIPAAAARNVVRTFGAILVAATVVGTFSAVVGLYGSYHLDIPSGPAIVLTGAAVYAVSHGVAVAREHRRSARARTAVGPAPR